MKNLFDLVGWALALVFAIGLAYGLGLFLSHLVTNLHSGFAG